MPVEQLQLSNPINSTTTGTLQIVEREHILQILRETNGVVGGRHGAAFRLGLKRTTLVSKMEKLGISHDRKGNFVVKERDSEGAPHPKILR